MPVNIGNPGEFTILECAQAVLEVTGSKSELRFQALPEDDPTRRCPDITKARALLGLGAADLTQAGSGEVTRILQARSRTRRQRIEKAARPTLDSFTNEGCPIHFTVSS